MIGEDLAAPTRERDVRRLGRARTPWRAAARLARRDVRRNPRRTALIAGLLALPLAIVTLWLVTYATQLQPLSGAENRVPAGSEAELSYLGVPVLQDGPDFTDHETLADPPEEEATWAETKAALLDALPEARGRMTAECVSHYLTVSVRWASVCTYLPVGGGNGDIVGKAPQEPDEILVPAGTGTAVGDEIETVLDGVTSTFRVVGTFVPDDWHPDELLVAAPDDTVVAAGSLSLVAPEVRWDDVVRLNEAGFLVRARAAILEDPDPSRIPFHTQGYVAHQEPTTSDADLAIVALAIAAVVLLLVLVVAPSHVVGVRRSTRTYALLAVTGADARTLRSIVLLGAALQGVITAGAGIALGLAVAFGIAAVAPNALTGNPQPVLVPWTWLAALACVAVATVVAAALVPARTAARTDVVRVLAGRRGEAPGRLRTPALGLVLVSVGLGAGVWSALTADRAGVVIALLAFVTGMLLCSGALVDLTARLVAPRVGLPMRLALRDAVRHRSRSIAAITAVMAAAGALVGTAALIESHDLHAATVTVHRAQHGAVVVQRSSEGREGVIDEVVTAVREADPGAALGTVLVPGVRLPGVPHPVALGRSLGDVAVSPDPALQCPAFVDGAEVTVEETDWLRDNDARCAPQSEDYGSTWSASVFIDDGTWVAASGLPGAAEAAAQLAEGTAVVRDPVALHEGGAVHLTFTRYDSEGETAQQTSAEVPGVVSPALRQTSYEAIIPPAVAEALGVEAVADGLIALPSSDSTRDPIEAAARTAMSDAGWVNVEDHRGRVGPLLTGILSGSSVVLGFGVAGLVLLLLAGESRADLAVMSAVGAAPRTRRRLAAAQAGTLVVIGTVLGAILGIAVAAAFIALSARKYDYVDPSWAFVVPWASVVAVMVALPAAAWVTGWVTTRSRLPAPSDVR